MEIEDLAVMVQRGFEEVHDKIKGMATKEDLYNLEVGLRGDMQAMEDRLDNKIEGLGMRFGSYMTDCETNFDDLDIRVSKIEDKIVKVK